MIESIMLTCISIGNLYNIVIGSIYCVALVGISTKSSLDYYKRNNDQTEIFIKDEYQMLFQSEHI